MLYVLRLITAIVFLIILICYVFGIAKVKLDLNALWLICIIVVLISPLTEFTIAHFFSGKFK